MPVKSSDELTVEFSAYDANTDLHYATYQFLDAGGQPVGQAPGFDLGLSQSWMPRGRRAGRQILRDGRAGGLAVAFLLSTPDGKSLGAIGAWGGCEELRGSD